MIEIVLVFSVSDNIVLLESLCNDKIGLVEYSQFYKKDMMQSAEEALIEVGLSVQLAYPLYLSMDWWNDMHDWACKVLGKEANIYLPKEKK